MLWFTLTKILVVAVRLAGLCVCPTTLLVDALGPVQSLVLELAHSGISLLVFAAYVEGQQRANLGAKVAGLYSKS
jgi:hypothetical protein